MYLVKIEWIQKDSYNGQFKTMTVQGYCTDLPKPDVCFELEIRQGKNKIISDFGLVKDIRTYKDLIVFYTKDSAFELSVLEKHLETTPSNVISFEQFKQKKGPKAALPKKKTFKALEDEINKKKGLDKYRKN